MLLATVSDDFYKLADSQNYDVLTYPVVTNDNVKLQLVRVGVKGDPDGFKGQLVLITHDLGTDCEEYFINGALSVLSTLKDSGNFDIWCGNFRGTKYSPTDKEYLMDDIIENDFEAFTKAILAERPEYQ